MNLVTGASLLALAKSIYCKRKIPVSVDSVSTVVVLCEWNPQHVRYTTVNFAFNSILFLLNVSFVLFDMSSWNIYRWDCMLSKAVFRHSHINLACNASFIIRDLRSRTITAAAQAKDAVRVQYVTLHRNLMLKVKARSRHACTTRWACRRSRICTY